MPGDLRGVGDGVGDSVVHLSQPSSGSVSEVGHLNRSGLAREDTQSVVGGMPSQIDEDIDLIADDLLGGSGIIELKDIHPLVT